MFENMGRIRYAGHDGWWPCRPPSIAGESRSLWPEDEDPLEPKPKKSRKRRSQNANDAGSERIPMFPEREPSQASEREPTNQPDLTVPNQPDQPPAPAREIASLPTSTAEITSEADEILDDKSRVDTGSEDVHNLDRDERKPEDSTDS